MSFYRSDETSFFKLVIPRENAWDIMNELGAFFPIQVSKNSSTSSPPPRPPSPDPSMLTSEDAKIHSTDSKDYKSYLKRNESTRDERISLNKHITSCSDCGSSKPTKAEVILLAYWTMLSDKSIRPGTIMKIWWRGLKSWPRKTKNIETI